MTDQEFVLREFLQASGLSLAAVDQVAKELVAEGSLDASAGVVLDAFEVAAGARTLAASAAGRDLSALIIQATQTREERDYLAAIDAARAAEKLAAKGDGTSTATANEIWQAASAGVRTAAGLLGVNLGKRGGASGTKGVGWDDLVPGIALGKAIWNLFTGGHDAPEPDLLKYLMPAKINFDATLDSSTGRVLSADYNQFGAARGYGAPAAEVEPSPAMLADEGAAWREPAAMPAAVPAVVFDQDFFSAHQGEIANAVRSAMLNSHSVNDVLADM